MDGLLVIDKPEGPTSHDVVARVRRLLRERRIGHTGTLDPLATGVLPLLVGRATRLAQYVSADDKRYVASVRLGVATTTYDRDGEPAGDPVDPTGVTRAIVEAALTAFRGTFPQVPPAYSAKKVGGVSAHRLARQGAAPALAAATVTVHELRLHTCTGTDLELEVHASAGFYVRSLAHDLGQALGCGAHLRTLRRVAAGALTLAEAVPLADLEAAPELAHSRLRPAATLLADWPEVRVTPRGAVKVRHGNTLTAGDYDVRAADGTQAEAGAAAAPLPPTPVGRTVSVRVCGPEGELLALAAYEPAASLGGPTERSPTERSPTERSNDGLPADRPGGPAERPGFLHPRVVLV